MGQGQHCECERWYRCSLRGSALRGTIISASMILLTSLLYKFRLATATMPYCNADKALGMQYRRFISELHCCSTVKMLGLGKTWGHCKLPV